MQKIKFDVFSSACPSHKLLDIIGNKWVILILHKLSQKTFRFGELQRDIGGISKKVLSQNLRLLEEYGLLTRQDFDVLPLKVEYSLTDIGTSLSACCQLLTNWAESNMTAIESFKNSSQH